MIFSFKGDITMKRIAIIDNGISDIELLSDMKIEHYEIADDNRFVIRYKKVNAITHGTICASIMAKIEPNFDLVDVCIFDHEGETNINRLLLALNWCLVNDIDIIHMSLGTVNYYDYETLNGIIVKLLEKNTIIVSAFHNLNIKSFPASCQGVFGVRQDECKELKENEIGWSFNPELYPENSFIASVDFSGIEFLKSTFNGGNSYTGNSYAAPIITANIIKYLLRYPNALFDEILKYLLKMSKKCICQTVIHSYCVELPCEVKTPIVGFDNVELFQKVKSKMMTEGYQLECFTDQKDLLLGIPFSFYCSYSQEISNDVMATLEVIYKKDIFLFCLNKERFKNNNTLKNIDIAFLYNRGKYILLHNKKRIIFRLFNHAYKYMLDSFESDEIEESESHKQEAGW